MTRDTLVFEDYELVTGNLGTLNFVDPFDHEPAIFVPASLVDAPKADLITLINRAYRAGIKEGRLQKAQEMRSVIGEGVAA